MNKNQVEGALEKAKGSVKETLGYAAGMPKLLSEGSAEKAAGDDQKKVGDIQEAIEDLVKRP